jgi:hypothetical protein
VAPSQCNPNHNKNHSKELVAPADNQTMVPPSELEHDEEKIEEEEMQEQHPSNVVVVKNGGKILVPVSSLLSNEEECSEAVTKKLQIRMTLLLLLGYVAKIKLPRSHRGLNMENSLWKLQLHRRVPLMQRPLRKKYSY